MVSNFVPLAHSKPGSSQSHCPDIYPFGQTIRGATTWGNLGLSTLSKDSSACIQGRRSNWRPHVLWPTALPEQQSPSELLLDLYVMHFKVTLHNNCWVFRGNPARLPFLGGMVVYILIDSRSSRLFKFSSGVDSKAGSHPLSLSLTLTLFPL